MGHDQHLLLGQQRRLEHLQLERPRQPYDSILLHGEQPLPGVQPHDLRSRNHRQVGRNRKALDQRQRYHDHEACLWRRARSI